MSMKLGVVVYTCSLKLRRPVQENHEFEASLGYLAKRVNINKRLIALL